MHTRLHILYGFLWAQVCDQLTKFLKKWKDEKRVCCKSYLEEYIKSFTDAVLKHAEEQKQNLDDAVAELKDKIQSLRLWQSEALPLM